MNYDAGDFGSHDGDPGYDDRGVPLTLANAALISQDELTRAVTEVIADLEATSYEDVRSWSPSEDGSVAIDSHLAVAVFNEFTAHLSVNVIDLAEVAQERWTSIAGVVLVILEAYGRLAPEAAG